MDPNHFLRRVSGLLVPRMELAYEPWKFSPCEECCEEEEEEEECSELCAACLGRVYPPSLTISLNGILGFFGICPFIDGDWDIPYVSCTVSGFPLNAKHIATYSDIFAVPPIGDLYITCIIEWWCVPTLDPPGYQRSVTVTAAFPGELEILCTWTLTDIVTARNPYDCQSFANLNIPNGTSSKCDLSSATCTVTAP